MRSILGAPPLQGLPVILEVPGIDGRRPGPREHGAGPPPARGGPRGPLTGVRVQWPQFPRPEAVDVMWHETLGHARDRCGGVHRRRSSRSTLLFPNAAATPAVGEWGQALAEAAGAVACALAARHTRGRARSVWALFALALAIWALTDGAYGVAIAAGVDVPEVSVFDIGWLAFYIPMLTAVATAVPAPAARARLAGLPRRHDAHAGRRRRHLDHPPRAARDRQRGRRARHPRGRGVYPALDLVALAALGWILLRSPPRAGLDALDRRGARLPGRRGRSRTWSRRCTTTTSRCCRPPPSWARAGAGWRPACARCQAPERAWAAGLHDRPPRWSEPVPFVLGIGVVTLSAVRPDTELRVAAVLAVTIMAIRAMETLSIGRGLITERDRLLVTDPLTGAYNRRFLAAEMDRAFSRAPAQRRVALGHRARPRPLQGGQRPPRPRDGRPAAAVGGAARWRATCAAATCCAASAATSS